MASTDFPPRPSADRRQRRPFPLEPDQDARDRLRPSFTGQGASMQGPASMTKRELSPDLAHHEQPPGPGHAALRRPPRRRPAQAWPRRLDSSPSRAARSSRRPSASASPRGPRRRAHPPAPPPRRASIGARPPRRGARPQPHLGPLRRALQADERRAPGRHRSPRHPPRPHHLRVAPHRRGDRRLPRHRAPLHRGELDRRAGHLQRRDARPAEAHPRRGARRARLGRSAGGLARRQSSSR